MALIAALVLFGRLYHTDAAGAYGSIDGRHLWQYVREQADIAERYRDHGHPQFWGRIAGTSGDVEDVQWLLAKYRQAGLTDVHSQPVAFFNPQWAPESWEVTATAAGKTIKLTSAQPPYGAASTDGRVLDLPAVYVGLGSEADFAGRDVRGRAVLFIRSLFTYNVGPADVLKRAEDRGAGAILVSDLRGGNFNVQAYRANTTLPSFNLGTDDAVAVRDLIATAAAGDLPHIKIRLDATWVSGQKSFLVWGTLPGATDETIYVIAHRDGWFDAAGDNASGVATLLGLAEYFARIPQNQRRRTMVFIGTDGHHQISPGGYGREWLVANRETFFGKTAVLINAEHPSEILTHGGATSGWTDAVVPNAWYAGGAARPQLTQIARDAFRESGLPIWTQPSETPPGGDVGPFIGFLPGVVVQSNDFVHMHTTGDTPDNVAASGLEAATRAYARIVDEVNKIPLSELRRVPESPYQPRIDLRGCEAWIKDSSATCNAAAPSAQAPADGDWPMFRHDAAGTGRSPLTQINAANVATLAPAWSYRLQAPDAGGRPLASEATPIVIGGLMYVPAANRIVALEPETGKEVWQFAATGVSRRGVAWWPGDAAHPPRIIFAAGRRLIALDAKTGAPVTTFGKDGEVDMVTPYNSVPFVHGHVVIAGANSPPGAIGGIGNPRAYDAVTGAKLWEFSAVAQPGQPGHDTWDGDSWKNRLGVNAWPFYFTMDEARGLLFVPLASPVPDPYGGDRKGANLYGNSVVALDIESGQYRWHFQTIHHDLWDADPPAPPGLFDVTRNGRTIPALALTTKSGYVYILNRETGQPVFGVEERAVPKSEVPGEFAFPTQPFPVKPPPIARNQFKPQDLVTADDTTAEHAAACRELVEKNGIYNAGPFTPWAYRPEDAVATRTALVFPGGLGGANWGGTAYDSRSGYLFVTSQDVGALGWLESKAGSVVPYDKAAPERPSGRGGTFDVRINGASWPCQKPPWGRLIAIDTRTGDFAWQIPLGITEQLPAGKQNTGRPVLAGPIVTASGLLFIASTDDNRFRALDVRNGKELWVTKLDRRGNADPITYLGKNSKQYVLVVATDTVMTYALP